MTNKIKIKGTPVECGAAIVDKFILPTLRAINGENDIEKQQFYAGLLASIGGSMVADFGHERAMAIYMSLAASLDEIKENMQGAPIQ